MIETLHIENIGIIDNISIDFKNGLNIITGETGSGKTLIVDSLLLICGNRFSKDIIKSGKDYCFVEILIKDKLDNEVIVSREITLSGKNRCKINGRMVTVNELREYMSCVINIHGQNDNQDLFDMAYHIEYLDTYCKEEINEIKKQYFSLFNEYNFLNSELIGNYSDEKQRKRKLDLLEYEINEIEDAKLRIGEQEKLEEQIKVIKNSEQIYKTLNLSENKVQNTILNELNCILKNFNKIVEFDDAYKNINNRIQNSYYELEDIYNELSIYNNDCSFDENKNNEVLSRLDLIYTLERKYGNDITEILSYQDRIRREKENIESTRERLIQVNLEIENIREKMLVLARKINKIRVEKALILENKLNKELNDLEMQESKIKIDINFDENRNFDKNGLDKVCFKICTNIGEEYKDLNRIASGGEISRIMLAIKGVLSKDNNVNVLVFDEVDTGISGKAAKAVGYKLKTISKKYQVICITHLAVVAAYADFNYYISKRVLNNTTFSNIKLLNNKETIEEIARISSGNLTKASIFNAKELKNQSYVIV